MASSPPPAQGWFESDEGPSGWRLDVVTLLAVIGESSIADHAQAITASPFCLLPRIIPAPQALLRGSRPLRMPETRTRIVGVYSGNVFDTIGFFANSIHPLDNCASYSFRVLNITHRDHAGTKTTTASSRPRSSPSPSPPRLDPGDSRAGAGAAENTDARSRTPSIDLPDDVEPGPPARTVSRRATIHDRMQSLISNMTMATGESRPAVPARLYSPIHILSVLSMLLTVAIVVMAAVWRDGTAIAAVSIISLASSTVGLASWWRPILTNRIDTNKVPAGDVVIRTREGAFILVKCTEEVARELYAGTEECEYHVGGRTYRALMGLGTLLLMLGVILLGNCKFNSQCFIGASYIALNGVYWAMGLLPKRLFWDLGRYVLREDTDASADSRRGPASFTRVLWYVIRETRRTAWVERSGAAPSTPQWRAWLAEAEDAARRRLRDWDAIGRKDAIMKMCDDELSRLAVPVPHDPAGQVAPVVEVQSPINPERHRAVWM